MIIRPAVCSVQLMARMGKDNERAALIYLHSTAERQRAGPMRWARPHRSNSPSRGSARGLSL